MQCMPSSPSHDTQDSADLFPNYAKSRLEVYVDFLRHILTSNQSLDIIFRPWAPPGVLHLPSWIIRRRRHGGRGALFLDDSTLSNLHNGEPITSYYKASGQGRTSCTILSNTLGAYILRAEGFVVGKIAATEEAARQGIIPKGWRYILDNLPNATWQEFWQVLLGGRKPAVNQPPSFYDFLCWDLFQKEFPTDDDGRFVIDNGNEDGIYLPRNYIHTNDIVRAFQGSPRNDTTVPKSLLAALSHTEETLAFLERLQICTWNRRLISTSDGRIGLAPAKAKDGDLICVLLGCSVPVILRLRDRCYTVIGESYIHGIMDGEAMRNLEHGDFALQNFDLV